MSDPVLPVPAIIEFDDIRVELDAHRLFRAGIEIPLEPKAFAVLVAMLARPGHAFARDDLLDAVWGHRHVTPGVLNRVISLLRRALGDDVEQARYLQTLHGVGYRLVLPHAPDLPEVRDVPDVRELPDARDSAPLVPASLEVASIEIASIDTNERPDPVATSVGQAPLRREADRAPVRARWWKRVGMQGLVLSVLIVGGSVALGRWWWASPAPGARIGDNQAAPHAAAREVAPTLAVLPLRPLGTDAREAAFAEGLSEELITLLAQIDGLRVTSRTSSFQSAQSNEAIGDIAARLKVNHVLEGSVRQDGEKLRITLRLVDVASDRAVWSQTFDRSSRDIFAIQSEIAQAVGAALRLQLGVTGRESPGLAMRGEDPVLYARYLEARHFRSTAYGGISNPGDADASEQALRSLLAEHPTYARAWGGLAVVLWARSLDVGEERERLRAQASEAAQEALRNDPSQPDAEAVLAALACRDGLWEQCLTRMKRAVEQAPSDTLRRTWYAQRLANAGYLRQAMAQLDIADSMDPESMYVAFLRARLLDTLGRHDEAGRLIARYPQLSQASRYFNAIWRRDYADARKFAEALPSEDRWRAPELAAIEALQDPSRWPAVMILVEASERPQQGEPALYNFVRFLRPDPDIPRDIAGLETVQRDGYASYNLVLWQVEYRSHRQHPAFAAFLRRTGLEAYYRKHGWPDLCRPAGAAIACD